jgi:uncharacterized protein (DUF362 family)
LSRVSVVRAGGDIPAAVRRSVELLDVPLPSDVDAVVKPNICNAKNPDGMVITDFRVIEAVVGLLKDWGCGVTVVESDNISGTADYRAEKSGLLELLDELDVGWLNLSHDDYEEHEVAGTVLRMPRTVMDAEYFVNLPKIKTCAHTLVTLGIKNLYGVFQRKNKGRLHRRLDEVLPYLAEAVRNDLVVVDGLTCMEGNGPVVGNPVCLDLLVAGCEIVSVDSVCSSLMGFNPAEVTHIASSAGRAPGALDVERIEVVGEDWTQLIHEFEPPYSLKATLKSLRAIKEVYLTR